ncbi:MAG: SDR family oxidoreductase [Novosphingobium sp.]
MTQSGRKAIFVTGAGSGIGRAVSRLFAQRGWLVGLADIDLPGMAKTAVLLPDDASSRHPLDVRDPEQWAKALAQFMKVSGGRLDVLFNNAGIAHGGPLVEHTADQIDDLISINFRGVVHGALAGYPYLRTTPGSCLLNTASAAAIHGAPGLAIYSATKFAVRGLTEALDIEWQADGIRVRDLMPGFVDTALLAGPAGAGAATKRDRVIAAGIEFVPVEEVAEKAWRAVHGRRVHTLVGKTARQLSFAARWMPGRLRRQLEDFATPGGGPPGQSRR